MVIISRKPTRTEFHNPLMPSSVAVAVTSTSTCLPLLPSGSGMVRLLPYVVTDSTSLPSTLTVGLSALSTQEKLRPSCPPIQLVGTSTSLVKVTLLPALAWTEVPASTVEPVEAFQPSEISLLAGSSPSGPVMVTYRMLRSWPPQPVSGTASEILRYTLLENSKYEVRSIPRTSRNSPSRLKFSTSVQVLLSVETSTLYSMPMSITT